MTVIIGFIIVCAVGAVGIIVAAMGGYSMGKNYATEESLELQDLQRQLLSRDHEVRELANQLAERTAAHINVLQEHHHEQSIMISNGIDQLEQDASILHEITEQIPSTVHELNTTSTICKDSLENILDELEVLRREVYQQNEALRATQATLLEKENILDQTMMRLKDVESDLERNRDRHRHSVNELMEELDKARSWIKSTSLEQSNADFISHLRTENIQLAQRIQYLESRLERFAKSITTLSNQNKQQVAEIKALVSDNLHLKNELETLLNHLEQSQGAEDHELSDGYQLRLFN